MLFEQISGMMEMNQCTGLYPRVRPAWGIRAEGRADNPRMMFGSRYTFEFGRRDSATRTGRQVG